MGPGDQVARHQSGYQYATAPADRQINVPRLGGKGGGPIRERGTGGRSRNVSRPSLSNRLEAGSHRQHDHLGPYPGAAVEVGNILIGHPDAAGRHLATYGPRLVRTVNAVESRAEIHGASTERIV